MVNISEAFCEPNVDSFLSRMTDHLNKDPSFLGFSTISLLTVLLLHMLWGVGENKRNDLKGYRIP